MREGEGGTLGLGHRRMQMSRSIIRGASPQVKSMRSRMRSGPSLPEVLALGWPLRLLGP